MKRSSQLFGILLFIFVFQFFISGCVVLLLGGGAAGGYSISKDEVEILMDKKYDTVWKASTNVLREKGLVTLEDKNAGKIEAEVEGSSVTVSVENTTPKTIRLRVKARRAKNVFPDMKRAQAVFNDIMQELDI